MKRTPVACLAVSRKRRQEERGRAWCLGWRGTISLLRGCEFSVFPILEMLYEGTNLMRARVGQNNTPAGTLNESKCSS